MMAPDAVKLHVCCALEGELFTVKLQVQPIMHAPEDIRRIDPVLLLSH